MTIMVGCVGRGGNPSAAAPRHCRGGVEGVVSVLGVVPGGTACCSGVCVIGEILPRLDLAVTDPLSKELDGRLGVTFVDRLDGNARDTHRSTMAYAQRRTLVARARSRGLARAGDRGCAAGKNASLRLLPDYR